MESKHVQQTPVLKSVINSVSSCLDWLLSPPAPEVLRSSQVFKIHINIYKKKIHIVRE